MIIGKGDVASAIIDREDVTFFASGVSNSTCTNPKDYDREIHLLQKMPKDRHLVYFSSLCIYYSHSWYGIHKRNVEKLIIGYFDSYTIIRLGNISWGTNPNTLINYLKAHPEAEIQKVYRHIIDKEEFQYWLNMIPVGQKNEMNIPGVRWWVPDLVSTMKRNEIIERATKETHDFLGWPPANKQREQLGYEGNSNP
jgi:hypothetical protein